MKLTKREQQRQKKYEAEREKEHKVMMEFYEEMTIPQKDGSLKKYVIPDNTPPMDVPEEDL